jgi:hypothetical protein
MRRPDLDADDHFAAVASEVLEHSTIGDSNPIGFSSTTGDPRQRGGVGSSSRLRPPVCQLSELRDQHQRPAGNHDDQCVQRQQLAAIRMSAHRSSPLNQRVRGKRYPRRAMSVVS